MICKRCKTAMVRVVNAKGTAHATCGRCNNYVECALCPSCGHTICLKCYNKPPPKLGHGEPLIPSGAPF